MHKKCEDYMYNVVDNPCTEGHVAIWYKVYAVVIGYIP